MYVRVYVFFFFLCRFKEVHVVRDVQLIGFETESEPPRRGTGRRPDLPRAAPDGTWVSFVTPIPQ